MRAIWFVFFKEIRDNLRDKRSLFFALIYGPLMMPALLLGPMIVMSGKAEQSVDSIKTIYVDGLEKAPNLESFLRSKNVDNKKADLDYKHRIIEKEYPLVLEVSDNYGDKLLAGKPALITLHYVNDNKDSRELYHSVSAILNEYSMSIAGQRLWARGMSHTVLQPIVIDAVDLSDSEPFLAMLSGLLQFLVVLSLVMGAFYLAVDVVAGERERFSLEPLLSLPLTRFQLLMGKYASILFFSFVCGALSIVNAFVWLKFLPDAMYGGADTPTIFTFLSYVLMTVPLAILFSAILLMISVFSKTVKEAQTQLSAVMMIAMAPFIILQFIDLDSKVASFVPLLGHFLIVEDLLFNVEYSLYSAALLSIVTTLLGLVFFGLAFRLFKRDDVF